MKYSTQHKYQCSEAYDKWALKNIKGELHKPISRQAFRSAWRTCIEGFDEWISVDDRLPSDLPTSVLVTAVPISPGIPYVTRCAYLPGYGGFGHHHDPVTHWMPLPEPPIEPTTGTKTPEE